MPEGGPGVPRIRQVREPYASRSCGWGAASVCKPGGGAEGGTGSAVTREKSLEARISSAIFVAWAAEMTAENVNELVLVPPDPLGIQDVFSVWNVVRYRSAAAESLAFQTTTIC